MTGFANPMLLRIYTDEDAQHGDERVVDLVVRRAWDARLAGATALRGRMGFGAGSIHAHHALGLGDNPPIVIEIVDGEERLRSFVRDLDDLRNIALVTIERVEVLRHSLSAVGRTDQS